MSADPEEIRRKDALLEATLPHVLFDGWSPKVLRRGGEALGWPPEEVALVFPGGADEAMLWLDEWADRRMLEALGAADQGTLRRHERIAAGVMARLRVLEPHREAVRRAIAAKATPRGAVRAARAIYRTVDAIWYAAGDDATDFSFYTKRGILGAIYAATVLHWLNDTSESAADTEGFLRRRLADVVKLPSLRGTVTQTARRIAAPFQMLRRELRR